MADKIYQFFVSSTYEDLKDERISVFNAILDMKQIPAGMEYFPAMDEEQLRFIERVIDQSDFYVLILQARYGSTDSEDISYTEREYDYAVKQGKPVIALLHKNPNKIERDKTDQSEKLHKKFIKFRDKVKKGRLVAFWENKDNLASELKSSIYQAIDYYSKNSDSPIIGWVRGNSVANLENEHLNETLKSKNIQIKEDNDKISKLEQENNRLNRTEEKYLGEIKTLEQAKQKLEEENKTLLSKNTELEHENQCLKESVNPKEVKTVITSITNAIKMEACSITAPEKISENDIECIALKLKFQNFYEFFIDYLYAEHYISIDAREELYNHISLIGYIPQNVVTNILRKVFQGTHTFQNFISNVYNMSVNDFQLAVNDYIPWFYKMAKICRVDFRIVNPNPSVLKINREETILLDSNGNNIFPNMNEDDHILTHVYDCEIKSPRARNKSIGTSNILGQSISYIDSQYFKVDYDFDLTYKRLFYIENINNPIRKEIKIHFKIKEYDHNIKKIIHLINYLKCYKKFNEEGVYEYINFVLKKNNWI